MSSKHLGELTAPQDILSLDLSIIVGEAHFRIQGGPNPTLKSPGCTISGSMNHCTGVKTTPTVHNSSNWPGNRYRIVPIAHGMKSYGPKVVEKGVKKGGSRPVCLSGRFTRGLGGRGADRKKSHHFWPCNPSLLRRVVSTKILLQEGR